MSKIKKNTTMLSGQTLFLTGGTGSFGHALARFLLSSVDDFRLVVYSRDEMKQWEMAQDLGNDKRVRFFLGDVRDRDRLYRALEGVDYVVHAAASKIVESSEYNPFEVIKTNVEGAMNLVDASIDRGVKRLVALSTDKASSPVSLYGASKLTSDRLFVAANSYAGGKPTRFSVARFGNIIGSRGSVLPHFMSLRARNLPLSITDERMTRFMVSPDQAVRQVLEALASMQGGEIFVRKAPSMRLMDIAEAVDPGGPRKLIGMKPGEKLHEQMIHNDEARMTRDLGDSLVIYPSHAPWAKGNPILLKGEVVGSDFSYTSDKNAAWMSVKELREMARI